MSGIPDGCVLCTKYDLFKVIPHRDSIKAVRGIYSNQPVPRQLSWCVRIDHKKELSFNHENWSEFVDWINELDSSIKENGLAG